MIQISKFLFQKFRFYAFVCIALMVFVQGFNLDHSLPEAWQLAEDLLTLTSFLEHFIVNGLLRLCVPALFVIAGYMHASKDSRPYKMQLKQSVNTLLVPYLLWSALAIVVTYAWQLLPGDSYAILYAKGAHNAAGKWRFDLILQRWLLTPDAPQLVLLVALLLYNIAYPFIVRITLRYPIPWFALTLLLWALHPHYFAVDGYGLFFYSVGVWLQKRDIDPEKKPQWLSLYICWVLFIGFSVIRTFMAFELDAGKPLNTWVLTLLHCIAVPAGILAVWFGADRLVRWCMRRRRFVWATSLGFFVYAAQAPLVLHLKRLFIYQLRNVPGHYFLSFLLVPSLVLVTCIALAALTRKTLPRVYQLLTGRAPNR